MQIVEHSVVGTRSAVLRLRRPGTELQFVVFPMFHVASPRFYAEVRERLRRCDLLVVEGVSGRSPLTWAITSTYRIIPANKRSGLVEDDIAYGSLGVPVINPDVSAAELAQGWRALPARTRLLMWLAMPIAAVLQLFDGRRRLLGPEVELDDLPAEADHEVIEQVDDVLGGARDERLLAMLSRIHRERGAERIDVAVVYGAAHTAAIVHGLLRRHGYRPRSSEWLTVVAPAPSRTAPRPQPPEPNPEPQPQPAEAAAPNPEPQPEPEPEPERAEAVDARRELVQVALARRMAATEPHAYRPKLAAALGALARRLGDLGRYEEALRAADEAVDVYEELYERYPGSYRAALGIATSNFAVQLDRLGRYGDALALDEQAVEMLRSAHRNDPGARADGLGHALTNLAVSLSQFGRDDEALAAAREAAELYRAAGRRRAGYSRALVILSARLQDTGAYDEALEVATRSAAIAGDAAAEQRAAALRAASDVLLRHLGRPEEALAAAEEALALQRRVGPPDGVDLAWSLRRVANALHALGRPAEAVAADEEALPIWRSLAERYPLAHEADLAAALAAHAEHRAAAVP
ncbi:tetratricopeptide repeat protein [Dactylosporangium sp. NPDC051485]|uniref:tetratricopeptide repeat protein n=1 Tax=Dactylosporangium sp. NPDC051485 TaxID=3154846 RepID=UPI0034240B26